MKAVITLLVSLIAMTTFAQEPEIYGPIVFEEESQSLCDSLGDTPLAPTRQPGETYSSYSRRYKKYREIYKNWEVIAHQCRFVVDAPSAKDMN